MDDKPHLKGAWSGSHYLFSVLMPASISPERQRRELPNFVCM